jgi:hypothetical protein
MAAWLAPFLTNATGQAARQRGWQSLVNSGKADLIKDLVVAPGLAGVTFNHIINNMKELEEQTQAFRSGVSIPPNVPLDTRGFNEWYTQDFKNQKVTTSDINSLLNNNNNLLPNQAPLSFNQYLQQQRGYK